MKRNKLILEFTEFNAQRLNPDSAQMAVHVDNPQLSIGAFDKHEDAIRAGVSRINNIIHALSNTSGFRSLKSQLALQDQSLQSLKVLRIVKRNEINYDFYISFVIDEQEYFGEVQNILNANPNLKSEVFKDSELVQSKEWIIRIKGLIIKYLKKWLGPEPGKYVVLNDSVICYSNHTGKMSELIKGVNIDVIRSYEDKIVIKYNNDYYTLKNDNFIYFNYWFERVD
jgi:hypothetical protein